MVGPDDYKNKKKITVKDTAFRMASKFGVYVHDIDISVNYDPDCQNTLGGRMFAKFCNTEVRKLLGITNKNKLWRAVHGRDVF